MRANPAGRGDDDAATPCLIVPGLCCSGPDHWQSRWERQRADCRRVELDEWDDPTLDGWVARLDQAIGAARRRSVLIAHSLGCLAVAWWARRAGAAARSVVAGALLVAPPDVDRPGADPRLARFAPAPLSFLPFPALVVASRDDPYAAFDRSRRMAAGWGAGLIDLGEAGHVNAQSRLGDWEHGQHLLDALIALAQVGPDAGDGADRR